MASQRHDHRNNLDVDSPETARRGRGDHSSRINGFEDVPRPFLIGVAGGTASGKSTVCDKIMGQLGQHDVEQQQRQVVTISLESFYKPLSPEQKEKAKKGQYNFDHPDAFDEDRLLQVIQDVKRGHNVEIEDYDFINHQSDTSSRKSIHASTDVVIFEGILMLYYKEVRDMFNMKLFVDTDADTRLSRRVMRDVHDRGRDLEKILYQYTTYVKPAFEEFCLPTKKHADVIIPRGADNTVAVDLLVQHIQDLLKPHSRQQRANRRTRTNSDSLLWFRHDGIEDESELYTSAH